MSHGELISGFLKRPQIPLGTGYSSGNPHVPCCCSSCSSLWLITGSGKFSLYRSDQKTVFHILTIPLLFSSLFTDFSPSGRVKLLSVLCFHHRSQQCRPCMLFSLSFPVCSSLMGAFIFTVLRNFPVRF